VGCYSACMTCYLSRRNLRASIVRVQHVICPDVTYVLRNISVYINWLWFFGFNCRTTAAHATRQASLRPSNTGPGLVQMRSC